MFYDCIEIGIYEAVVAFVSWIFHCAVETHECGFSETKMIQNSARTYVVFLGPVGFF